MPTNETTRMDSRRRTTSATRASRALPRWLVVAAVAICPLLGSADARADSAAQARFHDEQARKAYDKGSYEDAAREFFLSLQLAYNPRTAFNIALCFEQLKRPADAFMMFTQYLDGGDQDADRQAYARKAVEAITGKVARIEVSSTPPGARIYVDRRELGDYGQTPRLIAVQEGQHTVWVELDGYRRAEAQVTTKKGEKATLSLTPDKILGLLVIESPARGRAVIRTPEGQTLAEGETPLRANIPPGSYEVSVSAKGHSPWRGLAAVSADQEATLRASPAPLPQPTGDLTITSNVAGATIRLDGEPSAFAPTVLGAVPIGTHKLALESPGRLPWQGTVDVQDGKRAWVTISLEEPPVTTRSPVTWVAGGVAGLSLVGAGVVGVFAAVNHDDFEAAANDPSRADIRARGQDLNTVGDVLLGTGIVSLAAATILYFTTATETGRPSSATTTTGAR